jgi:hypothetical protein
MGVSERLQRIEEIVARFLRRDIAAETESAISAAVGDFNGWVLEGNRRLESESADLSREREQIDQLGEELRRWDAQLDTPPDLTDAAAVDSYNRRVRERNALLERKKSAVEAYNRNVARFNAAQEESKREGERRRRATDEAIQRHEAEFKAYVEWRNQDGPNSLWNELNEIFATLRRVAPGGGAGGDLARARALRREIAQHDIADQERTQTGVLLVEAVAQEETVWLQVDTGAAVVSLSPEIVNAVDWNQWLGDNVELILAGGVRLSAPQLLIPQMSIGGHAADNVKAVMIKPLSMGRDGCVGLSFLNRFSYMIAGGGSRPSMRLQPKGAPVAPSCYDVFICHKSEDEEPARTLFDFLRAEGYRPFFSPVSIGVRGTSAFQQAIDRALEEARHMVVVGSSRAHMESAWVRGEWQRFEAMRNMGTKDGNLLALLCGGMQPEQLPVGLVNCQAISTARDRWREAIVTYLPR